MYKWTLACSLAIFWMAAPLFSQQFSDDFADGNFTVSPAWFGDAPKFIVNAARELQLNNSAIPDVAYLATSVPLADSAYWEFDVRLGFAPSNSNNVRIYLQSDRPALTGPLSGYFIRIGENGSLDGIDLYRQDGTTEVRLIDGRDATVSASPDLRIQVVRSAAGRWELRSDIGHTGTYQLEGIAIDTTYRTGSYLGVVARHTSSNATQFYWDNFVAGPLFVDTVPPQVVGVNPTDPYLLQVAYSEWVDPALATLPLNYTINQGIGTPLSADLDGSDSSVVVLELQQPLVSGSAYLLRISGVADRSGNVLPATDVPFLFVDPQPGDVRINELMADPTPTQGLPEVEYIELWNTTSFPIDVGGWTIGDGATTATLPSVTIQPDSFLLLCPQAGIGGFGNTIQVQGLPTWPTLNNDEDDITLIFSGGMMDRASYRPDWYGDPAKAAGGYSLERVDTSGLCAGAANWRASLSTIGGTPGNRNSWAGVFIDTVVPDIIAADIVSADILHMQYDKAPLPALATDPFRYTISPGIGNPSVVVADGSTGLDFRLELPTPLVRGVVYTISVVGMADCRGNTAGTDTIQVVYPDLMMAGDVVINELLFNPASGGVDYLEVYNRSDKLFTVQGLQIEELDGVSGVVLDDAIVSEGTLLRPGEFLAFTSDATTVLQQYATPNPEGVSTVASFPNWPDESGGAVLRSAEGITIDSMMFDEAWHFGLLDDVNGVALERIDPEGSSTDRNNWFSASSAVGYGTPAWRNSQFRQWEVFEGTIRIDPEVVSPDGDGYQDLLAIDYQFADHGYVANILVADARGQTVRLLARNELLGQSGQVLWDGLTEEGRKALIGIYAVRFEVFHPDGRVKVFQHRCVVAGRL